MKKEINVLDNADKIMNGLKGGALLTAAANGKPNGFS